MKFLVTDIEFDFNTDMPHYYSVSFDDQESIVNDNLGVWEADDEDDLIVYEKQFLAPLPVDKVKKLSKEFKIEIEPCKVS